MARFIRNLVLLFTCWLLLSYGGPILQFWNSHKNDPQIESIQNHLESAADESVDWILEQTIDDRQSGSSDSEIPILSHKGQ